MNTKIIAGLNIAFILNLMSHTSYGWYIFIDLVLIGLNLYLIFKIKSNEKTKETP